MRILIIDDDAELRSSMRKMLKSAGHEVVEAENGEHGMDAFRKQPADVVVTDIVMPEKEGIETIQDIRVLSPSVPIVAISGGARGSTLDYLKLARTVGATSTLAKPFRTNELLACVEGRTPPSRA